MVDQYKAYFKKLTNKDDLSVPVLDALHEAIRPLMALVTIYDHAIENYSQIVKENDAVMGVIDKFIKDYQYIKRLRAKVMQKGKGKSA